MMALRSAGDLMETKALQSAHPFRAVHQLANVCIDRDWRGLTIGSNRQPFEKSSVVQPRA